MKYIFAAFCLAAVAAVVFISVKAVRSDKKTFSGRNFYELYASLGAAGADETGIAGYSKAIAAHPNNGMLYFLRGRAFCRMQRFEEALADMNMAVKIGYPQSAALVWRGFIMGHYRQDWQAQLKDTSRVLALDTMNVDGYATRAEAKTKLGDLEGALKDYGSALKFSPGNAWLYVEKGWTEFFAGNNDAAAGDALKAADLNPKMPAAYELLGEISLKKEMLEAAEGFYSKAIAGEAENARYRSRRGNIRERMGNLGGAASDYYVAVTSTASVRQELDRDLLRLGRVLFRLNEHTKAVQVANFAVSLFPGDARFYELRARVKAEMAAYDEAVRDCALAVKLDPSFSPQCGSLTARIKKSVISPL